MNHRKISRQERNVQMRLGVPRCGPPKATHIMWVYSAVQDVYSDHITGWRWYDRIEEVALEIVDCIYTIVRDTALPLQACKV
jgi:hypothetical protein